MALAQTRALKGENVWSVIQREQPLLRTRSPVDLKDAWRNLQRWAVAERAPSHAHAALGSPGVRDALTAATGAGGVGGGRGGGAAAE